MTAPERIWAWPGQLFGWMASHVEPSGPRVPDATEYVRADLAPPLPAALALPEVRAMMEALRFYANPKVYEPHPHGPAFDRRDLSHTARATLAALGDAE